MADNFKPLSELVYGANWATVRVRVGRIWHSVKRETKEVYSINLQLLDVQGNEKHAIVPKGLLHKYEETFAEELIYEIQTFNVFNSDITYRAINQEWTIFIRRDTEVRIVTEFDESIPRFKFGFVTDDVLGSRVGQNKQLTDVGGVLRGISATSPVTTRLGYQIVKRDLRVETLSGPMVNVTLWSDKTELVDESVLTIHPFAISVVITSTTVNAFQGNYTFASTNATKVYVNIRIPNTTKTVQRSLDSNSTKIELISNSSATGSSTDAETFCKPIAAIISDIKNDTCEGRRYAFQAAIMKIANKAAWSYLSCPVCKKTVTKADDGYKCSKCNVSVENPLNRYRLTFEIFDHSGSASITAFDKEAETLLNKKVEDMHALLTVDNGQEEIEKIFDGLIGVEAKFEIRPTKYDIDSKGRCLTANKITRVKVDNESKPDTTNNGQVSEHSENNGSKLDAKMESTIYSKSSHKGKEKVDEGVDFENVAVTDTPDMCSQNYKTRAARGIVIKDETEIERDRKKKMGGRPGKKRKKGY